jgi:hypothetical protein
MGARSSSWSESGRCGGGERDGDEGASERGAEPFHI